MEGRRLPRRSILRRFFRREYIALYLMASPAFFYLLLFNYAPMVGMLMAFQRFDVQKGFFKSDFIGLKNFEFLFASTDSLIFTRNTVLYHIVYTSTILFMSVALALMISMLRSKRTGKVFQTIYLMPYFLSWAAVAIAVDAFLAGNGAVNQMIGSFTGEAIRTNWYLERSIWAPLLVLLKNWKEVGFSTVLYLAVISGIPTDYYEAAMIDGATKLQQARYITIPHLRLIIAITLILSMRGIMSGDFGLHFTVTKNSGFLYPITDIIDTYVYRGLVNLNNVGMTTAATVYQSTVGLVMILIVNWIVTKVDPDSSFF